MSVTEESSPPATRVARQLNEILLDVRKPFGMFGGTNWAVERVEPDGVTVHFFHWPEDVSVLSTATNVRNAMLSFLRDTVPCARFHAVFQRPDGKSARHCVDLDFHQRRTTELPTQLIVIEENAAPLRSHWRALLEQAAGSSEYFTRAGKEETP